MRGTSMACPYAGTRCEPRLSTLIVADLTYFPVPAGAAALLLGARPSYKLTPLQLRSILMTTASWIPTEFKGKTYATVARQGGGALSCSTRSQHCTLIRADRLSQDSLI